jgi:hypothetical protein
LHRKKFSNFQHGAAARGSHYLFAMNNLTLSERRLILNLVGALLWCSFKPNRRTLRDVARYLDLDGDEVLFELLDLPPRPEHIDPNTLSTRSYRLAWQLCEPIAAAMSSHAAYEFLELLQRLDPTERSERASKPSVSRTARYTSSSMPSHGSPYDALSEAA